MQLRQEQGLWLWAGTLSLLLIATLPLAVEWQLTIAVVVTGGVWAAWRRSRRIAGGEGHELQWSKGTSLPAGSYRHPVVLVVGDCLAELFGPLPAEQWALRVTGEGCYVRVPDAQKLPTTIASLLLQRPEWNEHGSLPTPAKEFLSWRSCRACVWSLAKVRWKSSRMATCLI